MLLGDVYGVKKMMRKEMLTNYIETTARMTIKAKEVVRQLLNKDAMRPQPTPMAITTLFDAERPDRTNPFPGFGESVVPPRSTDWLTPAVVVQEYPVEWQDTSQGIHSQRERWRGQCILLKLMLIETDNLPAAPKTDPLGVHLLAHCILKRMSGGWLEFDERDAKLRDPIYFASVVAALKAPAFVQWMHSYIQIARTTVGGAELHGPARRKLPLFDQPDSA